MSTPSVSLTKQNIRNVQYVSPVTFLCAYNPRIMLLLNPDVPLVKCTAFCFSNRSIFIKVEYPSGCVVLLNSMYFSRNSPHSSSDGKNKTIGVNV